MPFGGTAVLDNFNRANEGPPPSADWTNLLNGLKVVSNQCKGNAAAAHNVSLFETVHGADCEAYIEIVTKGGTNDLVDVYARGTTLVGASTDGYMVRLNPQGGTDIVGIYRVTHGVETLLGATVGQEFSNGDSLGIECIGSTIKAWRKSGGTWTELVSRTDSTYGAGGYAGLGVFGTTAVVDGFGGGTISAGITVTPAPVTVKSGSVAPTVILGSISITPNFVSVRAVMVDPTVILGSITITPNFVFVRAVTINPTVIGGEQDIPPLGQGDTNGFVIFMISNAIYHELTAVGLGAGLEEPSESNAAFWGDYLFGA